VAVKLDGKIVGKSLKSIKEKNEYVDSNVRGAMVKSGRNPEMERSIMVIISSVFLSRSLSFLVTAYFYRMRFPLVT
jgi:hypothetical protein